MLGRIRRSAIPGCVIAGTGTGSLSGSAAVPRPLVIWRTKCSSKPAVRWGRSSAIRTVAVGAGFLLEQRLCAPEGDRAVRYRRGGWREFRTLANVRDAANRKVNLFLAPRLRGAGDCIWWRAMRHRRNFALNRVDPRLGKGDCDAGEPLGYRRRLSAAELSKKWR
jgi:hypothetical protein